LKLVQAKLLEEAEANSGCGAPEYDSAQTTKADKPDRNLSGLSRFLATCFCLGSAEAERQLRLLLLR